MSLQQPFNNPSSDKNSSQNSLAFLKSKLDPKHEQSTEREHCAAGVDIAEISMTDFTEIAEHFEYYFDQEISSKDLHHQIEAVWLYMAFSNYVHHWAHNPTTTLGLEKLKTVQRLDVIFYQKIAAVINNVNKEPSSDLRKFSISFHQKILMLNGFFYSFYQRLNPDKSILCKVPFSFTDNVVGAAKEKAKLRKSREPSTSEIVVNQAITQALATAPQIVIRKKLGETFIDDETGLELDFPLSHHITIETDGPYHSYATKRHDLIHTLKATILRETGWARISLSTSSPLESLKANARFVADLLKLPSITTFAEKYQELITLLLEIRKEIQNAQSLFHKNPSKEEFFAYKKHIKFLLELEQAIRSKFIDKRDLEHVLLSFDNAELSSSLQEKIKQYDQYLKDAEIVAAGAKEIDSIVMSISSYEDEIVQLNQLIKVKEDKISEYQSKYKSEEERLNKHSTLLQDFVSGKKFNDAKLANQTLLELIKQLELLDVNIKKIQAEIVPLTEQVKDKYASIEPLFESMTKVEANLKMKTAAMENFTQSIAIYFKEKLPIEQLKDSIGRYRQLFQTSTQKLKESLSKPQTAQDKQTTTSKPIVISFERHKGTLQAQLPTQAAKRVQDQVGEQPPFPADSVIRESSSPRVIVNC